MMSAVDIPVGVARSRCFVSLRQRRSELLARRDRERRARKGAVALARLGRRHGYSLRSTARKLRMAKSTLWDWSKRWTDARLPLGTRGRRPAPLARKDREVVLLGLKQLGARASLAVLRQLAPDAPRSALQDLAQRARRVWRRRGRARLHRLRWTRAGAVWACDFTDPDERIEGDYGCAFVVRDLASGRTLCSEPLHSACAAEVERVLSALFAIHGAPLVLKCDNGSALVAWEVRMLLACWGVLLLRSPRGLPSYNGACESGIGSLKVLIHRIAAEHGRIGVWTCDDVEAARLLGNASADAPCDPPRTPDEVWAARTPISRAERKCFFSLYRMHEARERHLRGLPLDAELDPDEQASIDRAALGRALVVAGYLEVRCRSISPPI